MAEGGRENLKGARDGLGVFAVKRNRAEAGVAHTIMSFGPATPALAAGRAMRGPVTGVTEAIRPGASPLSA